MQISIANIIRGTLIGNTMSVLTRYISRVVNGGGIVESPQCVETALNSQGLLQQASLLVVPSGYKGGTLYSEIPTNGNGDLTWTRGSDAFRTNASGLIQRVPWNLVQYSEDFSVGWTLIGGGSFTSNAATAPNGTLTADKYDIGAYVKQSVTVPANYVTFTLYVRAKTSSASFRIGILGVGDSSIAQTIQTVNTTWTRMSVTYDNTTNAAKGVFFNIQSGDTEVYIWGAQLVEGTTSQTYLPTTDRLNFPRLSYMYGSCPAVLLEPQRTNLALQSETFDDSSWTKTNGTVTANSTTSPDGMTNADTFTGNGSLALHGVTRTVTVTINTVYTVSVYAKKNTNDFIQIAGASGLFGSTVYANYDLNNGVVGNTGGSITASIQSVGNGWYRCIMTATSLGSVTSSTFGYYLISSATSSRSENNSLTTSVYLFGSQFEAGAYPTTYIPTTSATATRVADSFSRNNIFTNGLISASGGTWFVELRANLPLTRDNGGNHLILSDTSSANFFRFRNDGTPNTRLIIQKNVGGTVSDLFTTSTDIVKIAFKWNGTTADLFVNGVKQVSATSFTATQLQNLTSAPQVTMFIQQMALYPTPLTDAQCQTLTT